MMKKLLLVLGVLLVGTGSAFAFSTPRWSYFPLRVYISNDNTKGAAAAKGAFSVWQGNSNSILKFIYKNTKNSVRTSQISVFFTEQMEENQYYKISNSLSNAYYTPRFFVHLDITLRTKEADGSNISSTKMQAVAMQAIGSAMGIRCLETTGDVMSCNSAFTTSKPTKRDIKALNSVYKSTKRQ